jgi:transcriptional regulator with GAF, ATPase, and Fis domain
MPEGIEQRDVGQLFASLSTLIYGEAEPQKIYQSVVDAAVQLVDGCEHASMMLRRGKSYESVASTDAIAHRIDLIEVEVGEGPCLDAIEDEAYQHDADLTTDSSPWPAFRERILDETPVRSAIGYRLLVDGAKAGALNIFSERPGGLTTESADQGAVLAAFASVALMALAARDDADTLRKGLQSNREIGKAVGLLMAAHKVSADAAFDILRETSQELNVKLAAVAAEIIDGQELQFGN